MDKYLSSLWLNKSDVPSHPFPSLFFFSTMSRLQWGHFLMGSGISMSCCCSSVISWAVPRYGDNASSNLKKQQTKTIMVVRQQPACSLSHIKKSPTSLPSEPTRWKQSCISGCGAAAHSICPSCPQTRASGLPPTQPASLAWTSRNPWSCTLNKYVWKSAPAKTYSFPFHAAHVSVRTFH